MILGFLRKQLIRLSIPLSWQRSPDKVADSLEQFSRVEADSAWQMLQVAELISGDKLRCELFENALEEMHHAALFSQAAKQFRVHAAKSPSYSREQLFKRGDDLGMFLAYQHVGEKEIHQQFDIYAAASNYVDINTIFSRIKQDETCHQQEAHSRLSDYFNAKAGRYIFKASLRREIERLTRISDVIANIMSAVILFPIYIICGITLKIFCKKKLQTSFWYTENVALRAWKVLE